MIAFGNFWAQGCTAGNRDAHAASEGVLNLIANEFVVKRIHQTIEGCRDSGVDGQAVAAAEITVTGVNSRVED